MKRGTITSRAHDWVMLLPADSHKVKCIRCGLKATIGKWRRPRCAPHLEFDSSGYSDEGKRR